ncbi:hypothetical protein NHX12_021162, partial [Muraenolepis orangiensis]
MFCRPIANEAGESNRRPLARFARSKSQNALWNAITAGIGIKDKDKRGILIDPRSPEEILADELPTVDGPDAMEKTAISSASEKTVAAAYHLSTREAGREIQVHVDNKCLEVQQAPKYLGVRLDRTLSFKQHLEEVKAKVTSRVALIRRLAGTTWGASAKTLRISTQALVFSAAEYCAP